MENIFENAKFGDKYQTRDGRMALYIGRDQGTNFFPMILWVEYENKYSRFQEDGSISLSLDRPTDIIGKWQGQ